MNILQRKMSLEQMAPACSSGAAGFSYLRNLGQPHQPGNREIRFSEAATPFICRAFRANLQAKVPLRRANCQIPAGFV
jgi:hypothetical protein